MHPRAEEINETTKQSPGCAQGVAGNGRVLIDRLVASAFGQTGHLSGHRRMTEFDPLLPSAIQSSCVAVFLFDQLVRAQQDRCRHIEAKRLGGRHIEHGLVISPTIAQADRPLLALKDAVDVGGGAASMAYLVRPI